MDQLEGFNARPVNFPSQKNLFRILKKIILTYQNRWPSGCVKWQVKLFLYREGIEFLASSTVENYVKRLYFLKQSNSGDLTSMGSLASAMKVSPGTATAMVKTLADSGLVLYKPRCGTRLTESGEKLALHIIRRHRLIELLLVQVFGLDWSEVHRDAEVLEHVMSDKVVDRIDELLGHPSFDPHGDPIPGPQGEMDLQISDELANCDTGQTVFVSRILDQDTGFLQFVQRNGLVPGTEVFVKNHDEDAQAVELSIAGKSIVTLGLAAASKILVQPDFA